MTGCDCPRCNEPVSIPEGTGEDAIVCCPLCREEFPLSDALQQLPPLLVVVDPGPGPVPGQGVLGEEVSGVPLAESEHEAEADHQLADATGDAHRQAFDFSERDSAATLVATSGAVSAPSQRRRKKQKNPAVELAKIVVGGMLAIPIAQMILWWFAGDRGDPLDIGMKVGQYVPWIVPARYHTLGNDAAKGDDDANNLGGGSEQLEIESFGGDGRAGAGRQKFGEQRRGNQRNNLRTAAGGNNSRDLWEDTDAEKAVSSRQLQEALTAVVVADSQWERLAALPSQNQGEAVREAGRSFYTASAALGELLLKPSEAGVRRPTEKKTKDFLQTLNRQPAKLEIIARAGRHWLSDSNQGPGILLVGVVQEMMVQGQWFETRIQLNTGDDTAAVLVSKENPTDLYQIGDHIAALGVIEREPDKLLRYRGTHAAVVVSAVSARLPESVVGSR